MKAIFKEGDVARPLEIAQAALELHRAADKIVEAAKRLADAGQVMPHIEEQLKADEQRVRDLAASLFGPLITESARLFGPQPPPVAPLPLGCTAYALLAIAWVRRAIERQKQNASPQ